MLLEALSTTEILFSSLIRHPVFLYHHAEFIDASNLVRLFSRRGKLYSVGEVNYIQSLILRHHNFLSG